MTASNEKNIW